ncbi:hypothetical protein C8Q80DRAFT_387224 [Daedaleopsis nitida]|nr:hypothetical protein C8Q80DRAFT_387224 [Daedaleopsis nitida]
MEASWTYAARGKGPSSRSSPSRYGPRGPPQGSAKCQRGERTRRRARGHRHTTYNPSSPSTRGKSAQSISGPPLLPRITCTFPCCLLLSAVGPALLSPPPIRVPSTVQRSSQSCARQRLALPCCLFLDIRVQKRRPSARHTLHEPRTLLHRGSQAASPHLRSSQEIVPECEFQDHKGRPSRRPHPSSNSRTRPYYDSANAPPCLAVLRESIDGLDVICSDRAQTPALGLRARVSLHPRCTYHLDTGKNDL